MKYIRNTNQISSKIEDETIMVDVARGEYFALNPVASRIWDMFIEAHSLEEIITRLLEEYEIEEDACRSEVQSFVERCLELGVLESHAE